MTNEFSTVDTYVETVFAFDQFLIPCPQLKERQSDTNWDISEEQLTMLTS